MWSADKLCNTVHCGFFFSHKTVIGNVLLMQLKPDMERHLKELLDLKKPVIPPNYDKTTVETDLDPDYGIGVRARGLDHLRFVSCGAV